MEYFEKFKSKKQRWLEYSLILALVIIILGSLVLFGSNNNDVGVDAKPDTADNQNDLLKYIVVLIIIILIVNRGKPKPSAMNHNEIVEFVADEIHDSKSVFLNTKYENVRVQRGAPGESYVEFVEECITFLHLDGVGIVESFPGETIKNIKLQKQQDEIEMSLAKIGIAKKKHMDSMEQYGLTDEEQ